MNGKLHENIRLANLPINGVIQEISIGNMVARKFHLISF